MINELDNWILEAMKSRGFTDFTDIQKASIPKILEGADVLAESETGSGKTLAFGLPALQKIDVDTKGVEVLVVCPTRELAIQVNDEIKSIANFKEGASVVPVYGGSDFVRQIKIVKKGAKIVVGTPGRLIDHINRRTLKLNTLKMVVLDEADEMLNMGFRPDIETILNGVNKDTQIVMFSATLNSEVKKIAGTYQKNACHIQIGKVNSPIENVRQYYVTVGVKDKKSALLELMGQYGKERKIIFCNTKKMSMTIANIIKDNGYKALLLHGDMDQKERKITMEQFKSNKASTLIATDVAGRGIDVKDLTLVINYDMPLNNEPYIHRIGRTGRAGKDGTAITIINNGDQLKRLKDLCSETHTQIMEKIIGSSTKYKSAVKKETKKIQSKKYFKTENKTQKFKKKDNAFKNTDRNKKVVKNIKNKKFKNR